MPRAIMLASLFYLDSQLVSNRRKKRKSQKCRHQKKMCRAIINRKKEILLGILICYMVNVLFADDEDADIVEHYAQEKNEPIVESTLEPHPELNVTVEVGCFILCR